VDCPYVRNIDAVKVAERLRQYMVMFSSGKKRVILLHQKHKSDAGKELPVKLLQHLLVEQRHLHFRLARKQRVSLENLIIQREAARLLDMLHGVDLFLHRRPLLLIGQTFAVAGHIEGRFGGVRKTLRFRSEEIWTRLLCEEELSDRLLQCQTRSRVL
jgi:hypothetical protein